MSSAATPGSGSPAANGDSAGQAAPTASQASESSPRSCDLDSDGQERPGDALDDAYDEDDEYEPMD